MTFGMTTTGRLNISAVVGSTPSNDFSFGKVKKNKNKGTAILTVDVPGPGTLKLTGTGVKPQVNVTYTPTGDLPGVPNIEPKKIKLIDN